MAELIIVFREVFEAALIIGILYTYLNKSGNAQSIKMMWSGVIAAIILSIAGSFIFQIVIGGFTGQAEKLFEGIVMIVAAAVLSTMIIWMSKNQNISEDLKFKAAESASTKFSYGIFSLAFISVFREGIETILFLYGVMISQGGVSILSSLIGAIIALIVSYGIFIQGRKVPIKKFFNVTSTLLIFVSAGMMTYGVHELESAKVIPYFSGEVTVEKIINDEDKTEKEIATATRINGQSKTFEILSKKDLAKAKKWSSRIWDLNPKKNEDGSYPMFHDKGSVGGLIKGLFGYNGDPSLIEVIVWLISVIGLFGLWKRNSVQN